MYALAATLYTLLTGDEPQESVQRIVEDKMQPVVQINAAISEPIGAALLQAMSLNPSQRYQNVDDFVQSLQQQQTHAEPTTSTASQPQSIKETITVTSTPPPSGTGINPIWWILGTAVLLLAIFFIIVLPMTRQQAAQELALQITRQASDTRIDTTSTAESEGTAISAPTFDPIALAGTPVYQTQVVISPDNAAQIEQLARWGKGTINQVAYSPDGELLAVASSPGIYLYDAQTLMESRFIESESMVLSVVFSPDGAALASGSGDNTVRLWQVSDGSLLQTLEGHTSGVSSVAFSPDGVTLASGSYDRTVRLWQVSDGRLLQTLERHTHSVNSVAFSPDGATLASGSRDNTVRLWQVSDGSPLQTLGGIRVELAA